MVTHRWHDAREVFDALVRAASRRSSRDMYIYRVVLLCCRILIGAAVGLTALTIQMKTTSRGKFIAFRRLEYQDDDTSTEAHTFVNRFPTGWWFGLVFLCIGLVLVDHHATLRFATPMGSVRPLREIAVVLVEVTLIFLCFVAFFTLAVHPIFNHTVTFRLH